MTRQMQRKCSQRREPSDRREPSEIDESTQSEVCKNPVIKKFVQKVRFK